MAMFRGKAASGNTAVVEFMGQANGQIVVEVLWRYTPSAEDTAEVNGLMQTVFNPREMHSTFIEDDAERKATGKLILGECGVTQ